MLGGSVQALGSHRKHLFAIIFTLCFSLVAAACGGGGGASSADSGGTGTGSKGGGTASSPSLMISAIPDQEVSTLNRQFGLVSEYLTQETGLDAEYVALTDYASLVTAFGRGDIHLAWFGGLTGVQAQDVVPDAEAIAQRPRDAEFHSVFITQADLPVESLQDIKGKTFTFGSESSTSGHLMPRYFMTEEGIDPDKDLGGTPNYSGSHDKTYKLVEAGAFQVGALNEAVWEAAVEGGKVDTSKVRVFYRTPPYHDYHWMIHPNVDEVFGEGTKDKITEAILGMGPDQKEILDLFVTDSFIETRNEEYEAIRKVARELGIIR